MESYLFPTPSTLYPISCGLKRAIFLKNFITKPNIIVGDYSYYDDENGPDDFENKNVKYHHEFLGDKLIVGKFCQIAQDVKFLMNGIFHNHNYLTAYPWAVFDSEIAEHYPKSMEFPNKGNTIIENDVWIGFNATIMPGIHVGNGAIIGTNALVTKNVPDYAIVGGNPATILRMRFDEKTRNRLLEIKWWDWDIKKIMDNLDKLLSNEIGNL